MLRLHPMRCAAGVTLFVVAAASTAAAHHSFAVFDHEQTVTVTGTVSEFRWTNPHGFLEVDYRAGDGTMKHYTIELTSINMLSRAGWNSRSIKAGEAVKAIVAPLLSGEPGELLLEVMLPGGRTLVSPVPAANSFKRTPEKELK